MRRLSIYFRSKKQAGVLAEKIGCEVTTTAWDKRVRARKAWAGSRGHAWIVATAGLGTGIDIGVSRP